MIIPENNEKSTKPFVIGNNQGASIITLMLTLVALTFCAYGLYWFSPTATNMRNVIEEKDDAVKVTTIYLHNHHIKTSENPTIDYEKPYVLVQTNQGTLRLTYQPTGKTGKITKAEIAKYVTIGEKDDEKK